MVYPFFVFYKYLYRNTVYNMAQYLKLFKNHEEYENCTDKPTIAHCIAEVHIHYYDSYYPGCEDGYPTDYDLDGGYYF